MARVFVYPEFLIGNPDINAFLQAMNSRSHESIKDRLEDLSSGKHTPEAIRKSLEKWYVGFGHASIGDCGKITINVEQVSFLTAKAIQDHPLYDGQESSSRYIPFGEQPMPNFATETELQMHKRAIQQYVEATAIVNEGIAKSHPELNANAVKVKTFDIVRGLLPVTGLTQLSWTGSIRTMQEQLVRMEHHPYQLVREDALDIRNELAKHWPDMFGDSWFVKANNDYLSKASYPWFLNDTYAEAGKSGELQLDVEPDVISGWGQWEQEHIDEGMHERHYGEETLAGEIDYGGYRDVQRHRGAYIKSTDVYRSGLIGLGNHPWYQEQLTKYGYGTPEQEPGMPLMMENVIATVTTNIPQLEYMLDTRTKPAVHATVRKFFFDIHDEVIGCFPNLKDRFTLHETEMDYNRRAKQTIERREEVAS